MHTPPRQTERIETAATAMSFAAAGRVITDKTAALGLVGPSFRSPPRIPGVRRSVTRNRDGSVTIAVVVRQRPLSAVLADMIDGVVLTSGLHASAARNLYDGLWTEAHRWLLEAGSPVARTPEVSRSPNTIALRAVA